MDTPIAPQEARHALGTEVGSGNRRLDVERINERPIDKRKARVIELLDQLEDGSAPADFAALLLEEGPLHTGAGREIVNEDIKGDGFFFIASAGIGTANKVGTGTITVTGQGRDRRVRRLRAIYDIEAALHFDDHRAILLERSGTAQERAPVQRVESLLFLASMAMGRGQDKAARAILQSTADLIQEWHHGGPIEPLEL